MSIPELTFWQKWCCCCCCEPCLPPQTSPVEHINPPKELSVTTDAQKAHNFDKRLKQNRHERLASTEMLTVRTALGMDDSEYNIYMQNRSPNALAAAASKPSSDPLPTSRKTNAISIDLLALNNLQPMSKTP